MPEPTSPEPSGGVPAGPVAPAIVVGLGNPGPEYAGNRHNVGFQVVDVLAERIGGRFARHRARADVVEGHLDRQRLILAKPRTFMNLSGAAVAGLRRYFAVPTDHIVVVHDELDLPFGALRFKLGGGDGGHNGLRSISASLAARDYLRVRVGIGRPPGRQDPADFVLRDFSAAERRELPLLLDRVADGVEVLVREGLAVAQNACHGSLEP